MKCNIQKSGANATRKSAAAVGLLACLVVAGAPARAEEFEAPNQRDGAYRRTDSAATADSVVERLALQSRQIERLDRLYHGFAARRLEQESRIAAWQEQLRQAQSPLRPDEEDESRAAGLVRDIGQARQTIATDFLRTRSQALQTLTPSQRTRLDALERELAPDDDRLARDDKYGQLLLLRVEDIVDTPIDRATRRRLLDERRSDERVNHDLRNHERRNDDRRDGRRRAERRRSGTARVGVYGGYGYGGPTYGVSGGYGRGPIGVYGGLGRGGASFGIGIGRIFGVGR